MSLDDTCESLTSPTWHHVRSPGLKVLLSGCYAFLVRVEDAASTRVPQSCGGDDLTNREPISRVDAAVGLLGRTGGGQRRAPVCGICCAHTTASRSHSAAGRAQPHEWFGVSKIYRMRAPGNLEVPRPGRLNTGRLELRSGEACFRTNRPLPRTRHEPPVKLVKLNPISAYEIS